MGLVEVIETSSGHKIEVYDDCIVGPEEQARIQEEINLLLSRAILNQCQRTNGEAKMGERMV